MSQCGVHKCLPHDPSILSPRGLPGRSRPCFPRVGMRGNFVKLNPSQNWLINAFDYDSIMIYGEYAFSKSPNRLKTMEAKNGKKLLNPYEKQKMTASDIERVKKMYKCQ
ncbi:metalloendopeptidase [Trichonephila clavipes]|nr:metalloendopeptidase [Trichonephila clavipes]